MAKPSSLPIRLLLVEDRGVVRTGLRLVIESRPGLQVIGEAATRIEMLGAVAQGRPDIILLDLDLSESNGLALLPELCAAAPAARVLVLTGLRDPEMHRQAACLGAVGVVLKEKTAEVLLRAIEKVYAGEVWLERRLIAGVLQEKIRRDQPGPLDPEVAKIATLTAREREVVALVCKGLRNKQIAQRLFLSEATVRNHLTAVYAKLGSANRLTLAIYASLHGLAQLS